MKLLTAFFLSLTLYSSCIFANAEHERTNYIDPTGECSNENSWTIPECMPPVFLYCPNDLSFFNRVTFLNINGFSKFYSTSGSVDNRHTNFDDIVSDVVENHPEILNNCKRFELSEWKFLNQLTY